MKKCPVTIGFEANGNAQLIYCGKWSCRYCSQRNAGKWAKRAELGLKAIGIDQNVEGWFLTLTLGSNFRSVTDGFTAIPRLWDATRKAYQRYYGGFLYMACVEGQENRGGMPHFHILTDVEPPTKRGRRGYVTKRGVHDFAVALGWGYMAELELVNSAQAAVYISKYSSKGDPFMPKNFRRIRVSHTWPELPDLGGQKMLVLARDEDVPHFILRVSDYTGVSPETIYKEYSQKMSELVLKQILG